MRAKITVGTGIVIEVEGTPEEVVGLVEGLHLKYGFSEQIAGSPDVRLQSDTERQAVIPSPSAQTEGGGTLKDSPTLDVSPDDNPPIAAKPKSENKSEHLPDRFVPDVVCPFCWSDLDEYTTVDTECYVCDRSLVVDADGKIMSKVIDVWCPISTCGVNEMVDRAGPVECSECGHRYMVDEDGEVVDPGENVSDNVCNVCGDHYYEAYVADQGFVREDCSCPSNEEDEDSDEDSEDEDFEDGQEEEVGPICSNCPQCRKDFETDAAGEVECGGCGWEFGVDEDGDTYPTLIEWACPRCSRHNQTDEPGEVACQECGWRCVVEEGEKFIASKGLIEWDCPVCIYRNQATHQREVRCSNLTCNQSFSIDDSGALDPAPFDWECPDCTTVNVCQRSGTSVCQFSRCGCSVVIDKNGEITGGILRGRCPSCEAPLCRSQPGIHRCRECGVRALIEGDGNVSPVPASR